MPYNSDNIKYNNIFTILLLIFTLSFLCVYIYLTIFYNIKCSHCCKKPKISLYEHDIPNNVSDNVSNNV